MWNVDVKGSTLNTIIYKSEHIPIQNSAPPTRHDCLRFFFTRRRRKPTVHITFAFYRARLSRNYVLIKLNKNLAN